MGVPLADDEFASITESSPLVAELREQIGREGPIPFREFMRQALYHPVHGYYATSAAVTSRGGDYVTSPEVHPVFATLVCKQIIEFWRALDRPAVFTIVEAGGGRGLLARDLLLRAQREPGFCDAVRYQLVERAHLVRAAQEQTLAAAHIEPDRVAWSEQLPAGFEGCAVTNELLDSFPVHRVVRAGSELREVYVTYDSGSFRDELGPPNPRIASYFADLGLMPGDGCYAEVNLDAVDWIRDAAASIERGYVLTFDYGYAARDLYAPWRKDGTLLCFYRQSVSSDPYQRVGRQDITTSIDFTTIQREGDAAGLRTVAMTDQAQFLVRMGIGEGVAAAAVRETPQIEEYFARRNVALDLIDPGGLGRIKVLLQAKDAADHNFTGFADA